MHNKEEMIEIIKTVLKETYGLPEAMLKNKARLFHDLYLWGDDEVDFFNDLSVRLDIFDPIFDSSEYFPPEGGVWIIPWLFKYLPPFTTDTYKEMSIEHLADMIYQHRLKQMKAEGRE